MSEGFSERLGRRIAGGAAPAVVGLDPRVEALPAGVRPGAAPTERILAFFEAVVPLLARHVPVVKPNIAFFEAHGATGYAAYETTCRMARDAGLLVIGDVKRGDIGSTAEAYAGEHFRHADAVTLHPYLGGDSIEPFLRHCRDTGRGVFVLVRTSNPSAAELQDLQVVAGPGAEPAARVCDHVADAVAAWGATLVDSTGYSPVGAVIGATCAHELAAMRARMPHAWLLLPGVGAQGGTVSDLGPAFDARGLGAVVSQSRGVLGCFDPDDGAWLDRIEAALVGFTEELRSVSRSSTGNRT